MSMDINVYLPTPLGSEHIPAITRRLAELGLQSASESDFSFRDNGFIPIKISLTIGPNEYRNQPFDTGFEMELYIILNPIRHAKDASKNLVENRACLLHIIFRRIMTNFA